MKNLVFILVSCFFLSGFVSTADAAFVVKPNAATAGSAPAATDNATTTQAKKDNSIIGRIKSKLFPDGYRHGGGGRDARLALRFGFWGLLFAPLGILAIIFGIKALTRKTRNPDLAIIGIVLGSLEVMFMIFFIIYIVYWGPFIVY